MEIRDFPEGPGITGHVPPRRQFQADILPGHVFVGWRYLIGLIVFDETEARKIQAALRRDKVGEAYFALDKDGVCRFMFCYKGKWRGYEGVLAAGLGATMVYTIGEGLWEWRDVGPSVQ